MADTNQLLYLEPDDEITSVVRRLHDAEVARVVLVAPGRSKLTTSIVALRLLASVAAEEGREIALVADASGRALAAEAGIPAFASVGDASADGAEPVAPEPVGRAPIHVVRGEATAPPPETAREKVQPPPAPARGGPGDETQEVPVATSGPARSVPRPRAQRSQRRAVSRPPSRVAMGAVVILLAVSLALLATVAPAATIVIEPASFRIDPVGYTLALAAAGMDEGELTTDAQGMATGVFRDPTSAVGDVTFSNYNTSTVRVDAGTQVAAGDIVFQTVETIVVPTGFFGIAGTARSGVTAVDPGPAANLPADAVDTVLDAAVRNALRAFSDNPNRIVRNEEATSGGALNEQPEITQEDVDAAVADIQADLAGQLQERLTNDPQLVYAPPKAAEAVVEIPADLVGRRGDETFSLNGSLAYRRDYLRRDAVTQAAIERLLSDPTAAPEGTQVRADSITVETGEVTESGGQLSVRVTVMAEVLPVVDKDAVRLQIAGLTGPEAQAALRSLGGVTVELWPGWVDRVPQLAWRIEVRVEGGPAPSPSPSTPGSPGS